MDALSDAAVALMAREQPRLVAATGLFFRALSERHVVQPIGTVLDSQRGGVWGEEAAPGCGYPVLRSTNMRGARVDPQDAAWRSVLESQAADCAVRDGDILVAKSSGSSDLVGKAALFRDPGDGETYLFSNFLLRLCADPARVLPDYLAWFLRSPQALQWRFEAQQNAVGLRNLQTKAFLAQSIPVPDRELQSRVIEYLDALEATEGQPDHVALPDYLSEQRRIVAKIEQLAARIDEARGLRCRADRSSSVLALRAAKRLFEEHTHHTVKIGDAFRVTTGGTPSRGNPAYWAGPIKWVSSGEVAFCRIRDTKEKITRLGEAESNAKRYPPNTVLLAMIGQGKTRGQCAILDCEAATNQNVAGIHVHETKHVPEYVYHWLVTRYQESRSRETGTAQPALSGKRVREMPIPLPPLDEQRRIVAYLDDLQAKVDRLKALQAQTAAELDALLPSILDKAFKGEL